MLRRVVFVLMVATLSLGAAAPGASAESCPNERLREEDNSTALPDCRAYEQVSPVEKNSSDVFPFIDDTLSSESGDGVLFSSSGSFAGAANALGTSQYIANRGTDGWSTRAPSLAGSDNDGAGSLRGIWLLSADFSHYVTQTPAPLQATPGAATIYEGDERDDLRALAPGIELANSNSVLAIPGAGADLSDVLIETNASLTSNAPVDETPKLYVSENGTPRLVSLLPNGEPSPGGAYSGAYFPSFGSLGGGVNASPTPDQNVISLDGSRIFWTSVASRQLYMTPRTGPSIDVSASQRVPVDPVGTQPVTFRWATPSGSEVFFTSSEKLTDDATAHGGQEDLYEYGVESGLLRDLSVDTNLSDAGAEVSANVLGFVGASADGKWVYYAASGHLAPTDGTLADTDGQGHVRPKVYLWHDDGSATGSIRYVTTLEARANDERDTANFVTNDLELGLKSSRVSTDGRFVLLASSVPITGYDTAGQVEFYRYDRDAAPPGMTCVSCGAPGGIAKSSAGSGRAVGGFGGTKLASFEPHMMSADGRRIFFETNESLVPEDTNGGVTDVYEWEDGRQYLISSGRSDRPSHFADASADGSDVFFTTGEQLVAQDDDQNADLYDARVEGGFPKPPVVGRCSGEACQSQVPAAPVFESPASVNASGSGNLTVSKPAVKAKAKPRSAAQLRAEKLTKALKVCRRGAKSKRKHCETAARRRYAPSTKSHSSDRRAK